MKRIINFIILACVVLWSAAVFSQNVEFKKGNFKDKKQEFKSAFNDFYAGNNLSSQGKFAEALEHYLKANVFNPDNGFLNYKIGECYLKSPYKTKAIPYLEKANKLDPAAHPDLLYSLGSAYHLNAEWDKATDEYVKFQKTLPEQAAEMTLNVKNKIQECKTGKELVQHPLNVKIENLGGVINSEYTDYVSTISADESILMFTSRRKGSTGDTYDDYAQEYMEDIYISYDKDGEWSKPKNLGKPVNTPRNDAIAGLSFDGQRLFVYRDDEEGNGDIYESLLKGEKWSEVTKFPNPINTEHHESTACLAYDGKTLYFVSNRPEQGAFGGRDIYMSKWDKRRKMWKRPKNLGRNINTKYNEESVFIHPDGKTLYFSSKGHNTMGGYDIFKSTAKGRSWSKPKNIGYPINSPDDDVAFVVSASGRHAYYSSVKKDGLGKRDLYMITFIDPPTEPLQPQLTLLKGIISDALSGEKLAAKIEIIDNTLNEVVADFESNSTTGKYLVTLPSGKNYGIIVNAPGYLFHSENVNIPASYGYQEVERDIALNKLTAGSKIVLNNIFFDFDMATLRPESTAELNRLLNLINDNPSMKIEISGHTDNKGSDSYNQKLSENRAKSVVDYLVEKGVKKERLKFKGYGETEPMSSNETEEGQQLNRRIEFKILSK